jgi:D-glycero-D-manno-heptose 1,7-bisphosphate phosphatase
MKKKLFKGAIFLDRDGVINVDRRDYVKSWSEFRFLPKVFEALRLLKKNDIRVVIITNQSAVNRGLMTLDTLLEIHEKMLHAIKTHGGEIEAIYYCPHTPTENCECRKPKPGMVLKAAKDLKIDLAHAYFVGDSEKDVELARSVGMKCVRITERSAKTRTSNEAEWTAHHPLSSKSLREAVDRILQDIQSTSGSARLQSRSEAVQKAPCVIPTSPLGRGGIS